MKKKMPKAKKKESVNSTLTPEERKTLAEKAIGEILEKYGFRYEVQMVYAPQAIVPRMYFIDTTVVEEKKDVKKND